MAGFPPPPEPALLNRKNRPPSKRIGKIKLLAACCKGFA